MKRTWQILLLVVVVALAWGVIGLVTPTAQAQSRYSRESRDRDDGDRDDQDRDNGDRDDGEREDRGRRWGGRFSRDRDRGDGDGGERDERSSRSSGSSTSSSSTSNSSTSMPSVKSSTSISEAIDYTTYARGLVKKHDANGNGMLDADERGKLTGEPAKADLNKDNVITAEEIVMHLSAGAAASASSAPSTTPKSQSVFDSSRSSHASSSTSADDSAKSGPKRVYLALPANTQGAASETAKPPRSYRFRPAPERLPGDLPSFFKSRDRNGDGQVAMSEYSSSWSKRTVEEFRRYDHNDDGIITAKEAAGK